MKYRACDEPVRVVVFVRWKQFTELLFVDVRDRRDVVRKA